MDQRQRELRRAAARDFLESLNHLGNTFGATSDDDPSLADASAPPPITDSSHSSKTKLPKAQPPPRHPHPFEDDDERLRQLEEAAADIDRFLESLKRGET